MMTLAPFDKRYPIVGIHEAAPSSSVTVSGSTRTRTRFLFNGQTSVTHFFVENIRFVNNIYLEHKQRSNTHPAALNRTHQAICSRRVVFEIGLPFLTLCASNASHVLPAVKVYIKSSSKSKASSFLSSLPPTFSISRSAIRSILYRSKPPIPPNPFTNWVPSWLLLVISSSLQPNFV
jgi:hypothetical protein